MSMGRIILISAEKFGLKRVVLREKNTTVLRPLPLSACELERVHASLSLEV